MAATSSAFPPCGVCRQVMSEFCGPDFMIVLGTRDDIRLIPFSEILPHSFSKDNLEPAPVKASAPSYDEVDEDAHDGNDEDSEDDIKIWEI